MPRCGWPSDPWVDPDDVRRAEVGEAWIIAAGRNLHLQVAETPCSRPSYPTPHRDGLAVVEERPPWVIALPDQEPTTATVVAGELPPPRPVLPPSSPELPRLRLQLASAVREGDELAAEEMVTAGQQQHPEWDWSFLATVLWIQRGQVLDEPDTLRQPAWRRWLGCHLAAVRVKGAARPFGMACGHP